MNEERYRLVRPLAAGGMAELFLGVARGAEGFEKPVAIKRVLPHLARDPAISRMFVAEAQLATHLHHQNIATVYDVGQGPEGLFLVMELVDGWDLGALMRHAARRGRRFPPHLVAFIGAQALAGLVHAYRRMHNGRPVMTAHRDISPSNILVSREGEVKVTDFGIARLEGVSQGTQPGTFKGKLAYAAPEQLKGAPATAASDQFSLGIVLYELLTGRHPFGDAQGDPLALAFAIPTREPAPLTGIPTPLADTVLRALAKAPEARFPQPEMMGEALARYLARAGVPATSGTLAAFLAELGLPPTLLELSQQAAPDGEAPQDLPGSFELAKEDAPWEPPPDGPELSPTGQLIRPAAPALTPSPASWNPQAQAAATRAAAPLPLDFGSPTTSLAEEVTGSQPAERAPSVFQAASLELQERAPRVETVWDEPEPQPRRSSFLRKGVVLLGVVVALGAGMVVLGPRLEGLLRTLGLRMRASTMLTINSQPAGATVYIDGAELGTTPLMMDNIYPAGRNIPVRLTLPGHKPWKGTFVGGQPSSLDVRLEKR